MFAASKGNNIVTKDDHMDYFRTFLKYTAKLPEFDNFEFRQSVMALVKKYVWKNRMNGTNGLVGVVAMKREMDDEDVEGQRPLKKVAPADSVAKPHILAKIDTNANDSRLGSNPQRSIFLKKEIKEENINPLAAAFARGFLDADNDIVEIGDDSDSDSKA